MEAGIVFQDSSWLVVDKPAEWLTVPSRTGAQDPRPCLGRILEAELGGRLWPVHRLDFEVSGLVVFAKTADAHRRANDWFSSRLVKKTYEAWSVGQADPALAEWAEWKSRLVRGKRRTFSAAHGDEAVTEARCLGPIGDGYLRWELCPITGRSHQLRFEMAHHGHPIVGDELYGCTTSWSQPGIALRSVRLDLKHVPQADRLGLPDEFKVEGLAPQFPSI